MKLVIGCVLLGMMIADVFYGLNYPMKDPNTAHAVVVYIVGATWITGGIWLTITGAIQQLRTNKAAQP